MAGIEKVCEYLNDFGCFPDFDSRNYSDNLQICDKHKAEFTKACKGMKHKIIVEKSKMYSWQNHWDFYVYIDGLKCTYSGEDGRWMRWFDDKRKWKRNMRKLLGVRRLNIIFIQTT